MTTIADATFRICVCQATDGSHVAALSMVISDQPMAAVLSPIQAEVLADVLQAEGTLRLEVLDHGPVIIRLDGQDAEAVADGLRQAAALLRSPDAMRLCFGEFQVGGVQ